MPGTVNIEPRLLLACYICDIDGNELTPDKYKEGKSIKVVTEECHQEVVSVGRRYDGKFYVEYSRPSLDISKKICKTSEEYLKIMEKLVGDDLLSYEEPKLKGLFKFNSQSCILTGVKNYKEVTNLNFCAVKKTTTIPSGGGGGESGGGTGGPPPEPVITLTPDPKNGTYCCNSYASRYITKFKYKEDPNSIIETAEDQHVVEIYETYTKMIPTVAYKVSLKDGLDKGINQLLSYPGIGQYGLEKLILDNNVKIEMLSFKGDSYSIKPNTFKTIFTKFKSIEILNSLIDVALPDGDISLEGLKMINSNIIAGNTVITSSGVISMTGCTIKTKDNKLKKMVINCGKECKIDTFTLNGPCAISFKSEKPGTGDLTVSNIKYDFSYSDRFIGVGFVNFYGFNTVKVMDVSKTSTSSFENNQLMTFLDCSTASLTNVNLPENHVNTTYDMVFVNTIPTITGYKSINAFNNAAAFSIGNILTGDIKIMDSTIDRNNLMTITKSNINNLSIDNCTLGLSEIRLSDSKIGKITSSSSHYRFKGSYNLYVSESNFDGDKVFVDGDMTILIDNKCTMTNCEITGGTLSYKMANLESQLVYSETRCNNKVTNVVLNYTPGDDDDKVSNKFSMTNGSINGLEFNLNHIKTVNISMGLLNSNKVSFKDVLSLKFDDALVGCTNVYALNLDNVKIMPGKLSTINGTKLNIYQNNVTGSLTMDTSVDNVEYKFNIINCKVFNEFIGKICKVNISSVDSLSSLFGWKSTVSVTPVLDLMCKDFRYGKKTTDDTKFNQNLVGNMDYNYLYYGTIE